MRFDKLVVISKRLAILFNPLLLSSFAHGVFESAFEHFGEVDTKCLGFGN